MPPKEIASLARFSMEDHVSPVQVAHINTRVDSRLANRALPEHTIHTPEVPVAMSAYPVPRTPSTTRKAQFRYQLANLVRKGRLQSHIPLVAFLALPARQYVSVESISM